MVVWLRRRRLNMPAPLIYAAGAVVARFIAQKGLTAAAKRFTKTAISEGKKHAADLLKKNGGRTLEKAAGVKKIKPVQKMNANSRSTLRKGATVGSLLGASAGIQYGKGAGRSEQKTKLKELRKKLKEQKNATDRAKVQVQIEKMVAKEAASKKLGNTSAKPKARPLGMTSSKPKLRKTK